MDYLQDLLNYNKNQNSLEIKSLCLHLNILLAKIITSKAHKINLWNYTQLFLIILLRKTYMRNQYINFQTFGMNIKIL